MKQLTFTLIIASTLFCSCSSKKKEAVAIPEKVITSFNARYPDISIVRWEKETKDGKDIFEGKFKKDGKKTEADFDDLGNFIGEK